MILLGTRRSTWTADTGTTVQDLVHGLPDELMLEIFLTLKDADGARRYGFAAEWVHVTWVCKRWRAIALSSACLWSSLAVTKKLSKTRSLALTEQLSRSGDARLDLRIKSMSLNDWRDKLRFVSDRRGVMLVETLNVSIAEKDSAEIKAHIISFRDTLKSLKLCCLKSRRSYVWTFDSHELPLLRSLSVTSVLPRATTLLESVTTLEVADIFDTSYLSPFLHSFPSLQELQLVKNSPLGTPSDYLSALPSIPFIPKLRVLRFHTMGLEVSWSLTPSKRFPDLRMITVWARHRMGLSPASSGQLLQSIFPPTFRYIVPQVSRRTPHTPQHELEVAMYGIDITLFGAPNGALGLHQSDEYQQWSVVLPCPKGDMVRSSFDEWSPLIQRIPSEGVKRAPIVRLEIHVAHDISIEQPWTWWLYHLPQVQSLVLGCGALVREILPYLRNNLKLLPQLKMMKLCLCKLDDESMPVFSAADFCQWLRHRRALELPLTQLKIREPVDRPTPPDHVYLLSLSRMICNDARPCDTGIEMGYVTVTKEACRICDASN